MIDNVKIGDHDDDGHHRGIPGGVQELHLFPDEQQDDTEGQKSKPEDWIGNSLNDQQFHCKTLLEKYGGLARALNAGKPVEKPQANRAGDVKNHLAKLDLLVVLYRVHVVSLP
jgi:hypothetical protein